MITREDIQQFINEDQAQIKREIEFFRKLTIEEKVKERKAIIHPPAQHLFIGYCAGL